MALREVLAQYDESGDSTEDREGTVDTHSALASHISAKVEQWEDHRDSNYLHLWKEYYRLWRGIWSKEDVQRDQERSKIITPALQQAVEVAVAEAEEATFGRKRWFEIEDDVADEEKRKGQKEQLERAMAMVNQLPPEEQQAAVVKINQMREQLDMDVGKYTRQLLEDFDKCGIPQAVSEVFLNGALYGTGIGKLVAEDKEYTDNEGNTQMRFGVSLVAVSPDQFAIDPSATTIDEAYGVAHVMDVPRHIVLKKQNNGTYLPGYVGNHPDTQSEIGEETETEPVESDTVRLIEYHGLVPRSLLPVTLYEGEELVELTDAEQMDGIGATYEDNDLVEAIVTIANDSTVLKAVENPYTKKSRCFMAYQHDTVPGKFWGRGVAEKGYNMQKGLDAEVRARIDGLALATYPMLAVDATRIPRGGDFKVRPGRNIFTNGDPASVLREFRFTPPSGMSFNQTSEFERMVQMGTGSMDSATPIGVSPRNQTASGMSMIASGSMKRSKRTMRNIENSFLDKMIEKALNMYMQFDSERYPERDYNFKVHSTMGIMARELEQQQLTGLLQTVPPGTPAYWMILKSLYSNSSVDAKEEMLPLVEKQLQTALNPPPPPPDPKVELAKMQMQWEQQKWAQEYELRVKELQQKDVELANETTKTQSRARLDEAEGILHVAKAEAEEIGTQVELYKEVVQSLSTVNETMANVSRQQAQLTAPKRKKMSITAPSGEIYQGQVEEE